MMTADLHLYAKSKDMTMISESKIHAIVISGRVALQINSPYSHNISNRKLLYPLQQ